MPLPPITAASLAHLAWALLWAVLVFAAVAGYGAAFLRAMGLRRPALVLAATAGFGVVILLGGLLNLFHAIFATVLIVAVVLGVLLAVLFLRSDRSAPAEPSGSPVSRTAARVIMAAFVFILLVRLIASVHTPYYQRFDDYNFYLAAPVKMIETHSFAPDPFSERRITSSVGGNQFLNTLVLATQPLEDLQMADRALGLMLLALLALALGAEFELTSLQRALFAFFVIITPQLQFNLTFVILPSALFFGLVYVAANRRLTEEWPVLQAAVLGAAVAAIGSMKSTYVAHGVIFVLCIGLLRVWKRGLGSGVRLLLVAALTCFIVLLPWMIANHADSGTWFYPMLGKGFHYSAYGQFPPPTSVAFSTVAHKVLPFTLPFLVFFIMECVWGEKDERSYAAAALTLAAFIASTLVSIATGGDSLRRYNYPCILPAILLLYIVFAHRANLARGVRRLKLLEGFGAVIAIALAFYVGLNTETHEFAMLPRCFRASLTDFRILPQPMHDEYAAIENAIPPEGGVLATVNDPFLFNFAKRDILLADIVGSASPKPGWPAHQSGEALAQFLLGHQIRYLIYDYGDCERIANYPDCSSQRSAEVFRIVHDPTTTQWRRSQIEIGADAQRQYDELGHTRPHLYDDGHIYVLDLAAAPGLSFPGNDR